jgi:hypothetical protein
MKQKNPQVMWAAQTKHGSFWWIERRKKYVAKCLRDSAGSRYAERKKFKIVKVVVMPLAQKVKI